MEVFIILFGLGAVLVVIVGSIAGLIAAAKLLKQREEARRTRNHLGWLRRDVKKLTMRIKELEAQASGTGKLIELVESGLELISPEDAVRELEEAGPAPPGRPRRIPAETPRDAAEDEEEKEPEEVEPEPVMPAPEPKVKVAAKAAAQDWWKKFEEAAGKRWITWAGALVLIVAAGLFVKYAFEHEWLGPKGRVILGAVLGLCVGGAGVYFLMQKMRALGQGLVGAGMGILYVSLWAAYNYYNVLPQPVSFGLMIVVTAAGMTLAVLHNAVPISFLSVLGGLLTPLLLSTGHDARDALFSYLLLLDLGVLGVAFFKRWRALDVLAFVGTWAYFITWYFQFYDPANPAPAALWLAAFFVVFLIQPFVYHMRLRTPIVGERFFLAVANAAGMFAWSYIILYPEYKVTLGLVTLAMSAAYITLGAITRRYISADRKAVFSFIALSVMFLTMAFPILLDFKVLTVAWAVEAPVLLFLAYKYLYFPVRIGSLVPLLLAAGRIFITDWPMHGKAFFWVFNPAFGSAIIVALAGAACAIVHHVQRKHSRRGDRISKIAVGVFSAFLALVVLHVETWTWMGFAGKEHFARWASSLVWIIGAAGFLAGGLLLRTIYSRVSGFVALLVATVLIVWDFFLGIPEAYETHLFFLNARFLAAVAGALVVFAYAFVYRRSKEICLEEEKGTSNLLYGIGILILTILITAETALWLYALELHYVSRCILPFIWVAGAVACLASGVRMRAALLRSAGIGFIAVAGILAATGYGFDVDGGYTLYINWRFIAALTVVLMLFADAVTLRMFRDICLKEESTAASALYGVAISTLFLFLSVETYTYFADAFKAQTALSIVWGLYAIVLLGAGFWVKVRIYRLCALALFAVTALKLVFVDMSKVPGIYRIVSFMVLGILMIGASYLYHKVEKWLEAASLGKPSETGMEEPA